MIFFIVNSTREISENELKEEFLKKLLNKDSKIICFFEDIEKAKLGLAKLKNTLIKLNKIASYTKNKINEDKINKQLENLHIKSINIYEK
jgi:hypothetical protein